MRTVNYSVLEASKKFPTVKTTLNLAEKLGVKITNHCCQLNKRGMVSVHWLWTGEKWERNQVLQGWLRVCLDSKNHVAEQTIK